MAKAGVNEGEEGGIFVEYFRGDISDAIVGERGGMKLGMEVTSKQIFFVVNLEFQTKKLHQICV